MRRSSAIALLAQLALLAWTPLSYAEEDLVKDLPALPPPRDVFLNAPKRGTWASFDAYTAGVQATLERRMPIEREDYAAVVPRLNALASLGFGEVAASTDIRFLFFSVGMTGAFRQVWRTYAFAPGVEGTRDRRLEIDEQSAFRSSSWLYGEGRLRMVLPIHDALLFVGNTAARYEDCPDNSFDWFHATMHDRGWLVRYDGTLFLRSARVGAIGPTVRILDLPRNGQRELEIAGGFTAGRHLGLLANDLLLANVLARPGDASFGLQILRLPVSAVIAYRVAFEL